jgi:hypothetical protein
MNHIRKIKKIHNFKKNLKEEKKDPVAIKIINLNGQIIFLN